jgi:hypothetical protein
MGAGWTPPYSAQNVVLWSLLEKLDSLPLGADSALLNASTANYSHRKLFDVSRVIFQFAIRQFELEISLQVLATDGPESQCHFYECSSTQNPVLGPCRIASVSTQAGSRSKDEL